MAEFKSWQSYSHFARVTTRQNRYVRDPGSEDFLRAVQESCRKRIETIPADGVCWRAQLGHALLTIDLEGGDSYDEPAPFPAERMKPQRDRAVEGRANPKGIPYLYLATNRETAMAEVRPWIGSLVSVGAFKILRELKIVNCTTDDRICIYLEEPAPEEREKAVWIDMDRAFSRPVDPSDSVASYVPTQILAELFKAEGYDGIGYRSSLGAGHNIVLYDIDAADLISCFLFQVEEISFKFGEQQNAYRCTAKLKR